MNIGFCPGKEVQKLTTEASSPKQVEACPVQKGGRVFPMIRPYPGVDCRKISYLHTEKIGIEKTQHQNRFTTWPHEY